ncbi:stage II sporulation protein R [Psychrobacillus insolitus]|uniref:Stage II sporulation protein R n=1 Tax=Psychrobacillus insolitus TaxID=1461 RepID=A0A2W7MIA4_9BACI|nr:stage II sporulation protein R [Psychrobacillus insolitus]PZX05871.1 stage II sporulation protein R [Psychrobacillus insolitus]
MLPDYEIKRATSAVQKIDSIILFIWMLLIMQLILFLLFQQTDQADGMRFRLIANSNTIEDQQIKNEIKESIEPILMKYESNPQNAVDELKPIVDKLSEKLDEKIIISTGLALFPPKVWNEGISTQKQVDSIVIKIGNGRGDNWWCALFPKVCYKDEEVEEKPKFFVWEWFKDKFFT